MKSFYRAEPQFRRRLQRPSPALVIGIVPKARSIVVSTTGPSHYAANSLPESMSIERKVKFHPDDLVTQTTAARMRGVSKQAIIGLIQRGKLTVIEIDGHRFLLRSEVKAFKPSVGGRPKQVAKKRTRRKIKPR